MQNLIDEVGARRLAAAIILSALEDIKAGRACGYRCAPGAAGGAVHRCREWGLRFLSSDWGRFLYESLGYDESTMISVAQRYCEEGVTQTEMFGLGIAFGED